MTKKRRIPKFKSIKEEAKFWDTHDITDFLSEMEEIKVAFEPPVQKDETLTIRIQPKLKTKLKHVAEGYGISPSTLTRMWIVDKLKQIDARK